MKVTIYTDGAARGNPDGPGGFGTVIHYVDPAGKLHTKEISGGYKRTTNNRMELMAAIAGLEALNRPCEIELYSDSQYLVNAFNQHWIEGWIKKGWKRGKNEEVKNVDLWKRLLAAKEPHQISFFWVKGHNGHPENERCDFLATSAADGDELMVVRETDGAKNILIATHDGMAVCFAESDVRPTGRTSMGVRGIRLREGDYVVGGARATAGKAVLTITENGYGKRTPVEDYRITNRGGIGIKNYAVTEKTGKVVGIKVVDGTEDLLLVTQSGTLIRTDVDSIRLAGRATQGVIVMRLKEEGDQVIALALAEKEPEDVSTAGEEPVENSVEPAEN